MASFQGVTLHSRFSSLKEGSSSILLPFFAKKIKNIMLRRSVLLACAPALVVATQLREGAGVQMYDSKGSLHMFQSRRAAMNAGMLTGHFPDVDSCHSACQAAKGCGHDQQCLCNCCDVGAMENDGCFCFSCGPIGKPITFWSEHKKVKDRTNPLDHSEEPDQCTGSMQMCGGMFGDTSRGQETQEQMELRLEKQAKLAKQAQDEAEKRMKEMANNQASVQAAQEEASQAIGHLQQAKDEASEKTKALEERTSEVEELEQKAMKERSKLETKSKETDLLKIKELEQKNEIETLKEQKKETENKLTKEENNAKVAEEHAQVLSKEVEAVADAPSEAKTDAKLLEAELEKLKKSPTISLGATEKPKELENVAPIGEQLAEAEEKAEKKMDDERKEKSSGGGSASGGGASGGSARGSASGSASGGSASGGSASGSASAGKSM